MFSGMEHGSKLVETKPLLWVEGLPIVRLVGAVTTTLMADNRSCLHSICFLHVLTTRHRIRLVQEFLLSRTLAVKFVIVKFIIFPGCSHPVTTEAAIGFCPQTKSINDGIQQCGYNFTFIHFCASHCPATVKLLMMVP